MHQEEQIPEVQKPSSATKSSHGHANEQVVEQTEPFQHNDSHNFEAQVETAQENTVICQANQVIDVQGHLSAAKSNHKQTDEQPMEQIESFEHNDSHNVEEHVETIQEETVTHQVNQTVDVQRAPSAAKSNHEQLNKGVSRAGCSIWI